MNKTCLLAVLILMASCSTYNNQSKSSAFGEYVQDVSAKRKPASVSSPLNVSLLEDFVLLDDYGKQVHYRMETSFWTNKDQQYLGKKLKAVLSKTMHDVLLDMKSAGDKKISLVASMKGNITGHLLNEFVKTLYFYKIVSGTFQFDIAIVPLTDSPKNFSNELSSNQLLQFSSTGNMSKLLQQKDHGVAKQISKVFFPVKGDEQFLGGNISIAFKLLDFDINPLKPIPNIKKNAVKGQIVYRKYLRKNNLDMSSVNTRQVSFSSVKIREGKSQHITADYIYDFNLAHLIPALQRVDIWPGVLKGRRHYATGVISHLKSVFQKKESSIKGKNWQVRGTSLINNIDAPFYLSLKKISYFSEQHKFKVTGNIRFEDIMLQNSDDDNTFELDTYGESLTHYLRLDHLVNPVVEGEQ